MTRQSSSLCYSNNTTRSNFASVLIQFLAESFRSNNINTGMFLFHQHMRSRIDYDSYTNFDCKSSFCRARLSSCILIRLLHIQILPIRKTNILSKGCADLRCISIYDFHEGDLINAGPDKHLKIQVLGYGNLEFHTCHTRNHTRVTLHWIVWSSWPIRVRKIGSY